MATVRQFVAALHRAPASKSFQTTTTTHSTCHQPTKPDSLLLHDIVPQNFQQETYLFKMSKTVQIASPAQFSDLLKSSRIVVSDCWLPPPLHVHSPLWNLHHYTPKTSCSNPCIIQSMLTGAALARPSLPSTNSSQPACRDRTRSPL